MFPEKKTKVTLFNFYYSFNALTNIFGFIGFLDKEKERPSTSQAYKKKLIMDGQSSSFQNSHYGMYEKYNFVIIIYRNNFSKGFIYCFAEKPYHKREIFEPVDKYSENINNYTQQQEYENEDDYENEGDYFYFFLMLILQNVIYVY